MTEPFGLDAIPPELDPEIRLFLARVSGVQALLCRDGEYLIREGEESQEIFVLLEGGLVVERDPAVPGAPPVVLACLTAEDGLVLVGEMAYLGAQKRTASVRSSGLTRVLALQPGHVDRILEDFPMLTRVICRQFSRRLQETLAALSKFQARFALNPGRRMAQDGEVLFRAGEPATELCQLMAGSVRLDGPGGIAEVGPDSLPLGFLELAPYLRAGPHQATATVSGMAFLSVLPAEDRETVVRSHPGLVLAALG